MARDIRVLRGVITSFNFTPRAKHLIVDDGNFNHAWRVTKFAIAPVDVSSGSVPLRDCCAALATSEDALEGYVSSVINWRWEDRRQFAWAASAWDSDTEIGDQFNLIDPTHVIVRDMFIGLTSQSATASTEFNYYIELERVILDDSQAVMAIVQEENQNA